jgi:type I site-specific restriction-modification system R (restriction) subunit
MAFFAEKVRRKVPGNFTFLLMTDRNDLDSQIYKTFVGSGIVEKDTPRAASGADLEKLLKENHRYIFSLIHKFNQDVDPKKPYSERDDIIVISDEAHRTQSGRLARNMRNREKDRTTIEETFRRLIELVNSLDEEQKRAAREGLSEEELALFDVLQKEGLDKAARERVKQASRELLASVKARLDQLDRFWEKEQTKAEIEVFILDELFARLPTPPFTATEKETLAGDVYRYVWQRAVSTEASLYT